MPIFVSVLSKIVAGLQMFDGWWQKLSPSTQGWIVKGLALLAVLGPLLVILGALFTAIGTILTVVGSAITLFGTFAGVVTAAGPAMAAFAVAAGPLLLVLAAIAASAIAVARAFGQMEDAAMAAMSAASQGQAAAKALQPLIDGASGAQKAKLQAIQTSTLQSAANAQAIGQRYSGVGGIGNAIVDQFKDWTSGLPHFATGGVVPGSPGEAVPIVAHAGETVVPAGKSMGGGNTTIHMHFPGVIAGDDGIKKIIAQAVGQINRKSQLRFLAGA
jgi:hypothetical protein